MQSIHIAAMADAIAVATKLCAAASQSARPEPGDLEWIHVLS